MQKDSEIIIKHLLGKISFKTRTQNVEENVLIDKNLNIGDLKNDLLNSKEFQAHYFNKEVLLTLEDIQYSSEKDSLILMINSDVNKATSTVFKNRKTKTRKEHTPDIAAGDRYEHSTHVVIKCKPNKLGDHEVLLQKTEALTTTLFGLFFNKLLFDIAKKNEKEFTCKAKLSNKEIRYKPVLEIHSKPDENFLSNIRSGNISDIVLIKSESQEIVLPDQNIVIRTKEHTVKIDTSLMSSNVVDYLKKLGKYFTGSKRDVKYDKIKVVFKNPDSAKGKGGATAYLDSESLSQNETEHIVTKKHIISDLKSHIKTSYEQINQEISSRMINIL